MKLKECLFTANRCFIQKNLMSEGRPTGIVVHSTGANNPYIKRFVQPVKTDPKYSEIIADLGVNTYANDWNRNQPSGKGKCVHAFIGKNKAGEVETYAVLPFDFCPWGSGSGAKGSYNKNPTARVQFEICEDNLKDEAYFNAVMKEAQEFCAYICKMYDLPVSTICSHREGYLAGFATNHGDIDHWLKIYKKNMDWFRAGVDKILNPIVWGNPFLEPSVTLRKGMRSQDVKWLQWELNERGYGLVVDGVFGSGTLAAVKSFQKSARLVVDGLAGKKTRVALKQKR